MDKKVVRLGIVGCGEMAEYRLKTINNAKNIEVTAVCDMWKDKAEKVAAHFDNPYVTTDYMTMADYVDAVYIATPNDYHYTMARFFARNKKHVLVEYPMCVWNEEAEQLVEVCKGENVKLMCAFPARYRPGIRKLKELLSTGTYGKPFLMSVYAEEHAEYDELHWTATGRLGGNQFFSEGGQYLDIMMWYLGDLVTGSYMGTDVGTDWMLYEGTGTAKVAFENDAVGYICTSWGMKGTHLGKNIQLHTEGGMFDFDFETGELRIHDQLLVHKPGEVFNRRYTVLYNEDMEEVKNTPYELNHFAECILTGKTPETDGYSTMQVQKAIWKMIEADKHNVMADLKGIGFKK